jgi:N-succinyl-L-ornithine transcarbamylase
MVMNFTNEGWTLEFEDGAIMNQGASEHIKGSCGSSVSILWYYRYQSFAGLVDKEKTMPKPLWDFLKYATVPVVNMEGPPVTTTITCRRDYHGRVQNGS